jgi:DNA-binding transcriptional regulator YhcF (GntR family)
MTVDPDEPTPLYVQLADIVRGQIERGELTGRVPSIKTLAQQHGVAMGTAERALVLLRDEGTIKVVIGRGAFVVRRPGTSGTQ